MLDLKPDNLDLETTDLTVAEFNITQAATYSACYKLAGQGYRQVPGSFVVRAVPPGAFSYEVDHTHVGDHMLIHFTQGMGLNRGVGQDSVKMVALPGTCQDSPAPGVPEVTDLGPDDADGVDTASAELVWGRAGDYIVCYRPAGAAYIQIGANISVEELRVVEMWPLNGAVEVEASSNITIGFSSDIALVTGV